MKDVKKNLFIIVLFFFIIFYMNSLNANYEKNIFDFEITSLSGKKIHLSKLKAKAFLLVNVASECGFTKQYNDLQQLWKLYKNKGLFIIAFPSNQFGGQEPGTNKEIKDFCKTKFNIRFPITVKTDVKGKNAHEIYKWALENHGKSTVPKLNFHKILINNEGKVEETFLSFAISSTLVSKLCITL